MSAEKDPLLSEAIMNYMHCTCGPCMVDMEGHLRQLVEADRKELLSLVQVLVDHIQHRYIDHPMDAMASARYYAHGGKTTHDILSLAKSKYGITPTPK